MELCMSTKQEWKLLRGTWISKEPVLPGVWQRKEGGHVVRGRATDPATGKQQDIYRVLPACDAPTALKWLRDEQARVRASVAASAKTPSVRFSEFAASHFEQKVKTGDIRSAMGRNKWHYTLKRLIAAFGDHYIDRLHVSHVESWREEQAVRVQARKVAPTTVNGWLAIMRVLMKAARRKYQLAHDPMDGVEDLDTSEHETYTEEEPNALAPPEVGPFVAKFRELFPQHFAMLYLGLVTGLRPSTLRPLRRRGAEVDVQWEQGRILVRRSHSLGDEVMRTTKQKRRYAIDLPAEAMAVLRWHVDTQLTEEQQDSDLLFPSITGGFRTQKVLNAPMAEVATELGITKHITQRALRRTFNDLARAAQVNDLVTRSISGHLTEQMQHHYSTVNGAEQRAALAKVIHLFDPRPASGLPALPAAGGEGGGEGSTPSGEETKTG
jgi:site-specific recombinase XerD